MRGRAAARSARRRAILVFASCATTIRDTRNVPSRHGCDAWLAFRPEVRSSHWSARNQILVSRALAPVELAIANWKGFVAARQSRRRLSDLLHLLKQEEPPVPLLRAYCRITRAWLRTADGRRGGLVPVEWFLLLHDAASAKTVA